MKSKLAAVLLASATLGGGPAIFAPPASAQAEVEVSFSFFHDSLSPYGEWVEVGDYGLCWRPNDVDADWSPYTDGYWSYTDAGWTWVSYEDFGGIVYHYGRWTRVEDEGWCWVPGEEWGPAWVSWRNNDDYVGWAPLPPEARWEPEVGFSVWVDNTYDIGPSYYNFCAVADFGAPVIREVIIERPRNVFFIQNTVNITNITINRGFGVPFCGGPRYDFFAGRVHRPIPALKLVRETNITNINNTVINNNRVINNYGNRRRINASVRGNQLVVPAPKVKGMRDRKALLASYKPSRVIGADKVNKGWQGVQDPEERKRLKDKIAKDAKGGKPENAPARPIETAELKPVPAKGDPNAPSPVETAKRNGKQRPGRGDAAPGIAAGEPAPGAGPGDKPAKGDRPGREPGERDEKQKGQAKADKRKQDAPDAVATPTEEPAVAQTPDPDRPDRQGKAKNRDEEDRPGRKGVAENRGPLKPFNADPEKAGGKNKDEAERGEAEDTRNAERNIPKAQREREDKPRKADVVERAGDVDGQEKMRKRQQEDVAERQKKNQQAHAEQRERRQPAVRAQEQEQERQRNVERRQNEERQQAQEMRRQQAAQQENAERRQRQNQAEAAERRAQQQQAAEAQETRRQQQAVVNARREQAERQQQIQAQRQNQAQRQMQAERAQQFQRQQNQPQRQQQFQQGGGRQGGGGGGEGRGGGGGGGGRGKNRNLTPEEAAALQRR